jgi:hypothetical protein
MQAFLLHFQKIFLKIDIYLYHIDYGKVYTRFGRGCKVKFFIQKQQRTPKRVRWLICIG